MKPKKTQSLSIFLLKADVNDDDIFKVTTLSEPVNFGGESIGRFYYESSFSRTPSWYTNLFEGVFNNRVTSSIFNSSTKALLLVESSGRKYAIAFGHGRHLLHDAAFENDFGLKVVLNTVPENSLRSINIAALDGTTKHSTEQFAKDSEITEFGINVERDLLRGVTGKIEASELGTTMSGRDSLHVSVKADLSDLKGLLHRYYQKSRENHYKQKYPWVDRIKPITDPQKINELDSKLSESLANEDGQGTKLWMAVPEIIDWHEYSGFRFGVGKSNTLYDDVTLGNFKSSLRNPDRISDVDYLKKSARVYAVAVEDDSSRKNWSAWKCIYFETSIQNSTFLLTNGDWYQVRGDFKGEIEEFFSSVPLSDISFPEYDSDHFKGRGNDKGEFGYNKQVAAGDDSYVCMDRDLVQIGSSGSSIEFCDLYRSDKKLVHVKRYSGSSSLSHLFNQGLVSGETLLGIKQFRVNLNDKLPPSHKLSGANERPDPSGYEIVFAIISISRHALDLPFFSKVSLRTAYQRLVDTQNYKVSLVKIQATRETP